jgi:hypothetical protein
MSSLGLSRTETPSQPHLRPKEYLKICGYLCFTPNTFIDVTGTTALFPESSMDLEDRDRIIQDALITTLMATYPALDEVMEEFTLMRIAPLGDPTAFRCYLNPREMCSPVSYVSAIDEAKENILLGGIIKGQYPLNDEILCELLKVENLRFFMHMYGFGEEFSSPCVPCRTAIEVERAKRRADEGYEHSYLTFRQPIPADVFATI